LRWAIAAGNENAHVQEAWHNIWNGMVTASRLDQANLILGVLGVWLMARRSLWAFPVGLVAVTVQGILFYQMRFPADAALQVFFFVTLAWGWRHWLRDKGAAPELPVTTLTSRQRALTVGAAAITTALWALTIGRWMQAAMPWRDAFIAAFSVAGQVLQARKNVENWPLWTVVNIVAIASYWSAEAAYTAFLYAIYLVLGLVGWIDWTRAMRQQRHG
jgi:nicotinamide mononucleotide transporter